MKLLRCHIENFGVLSNFDFDFSENLTIICRENGFGKSTFAAFIKAMFYGLPRTGARNAIDNERKRYAPWQGGKYGGFLEFEYQKIIYRVTRYFGKTASRDVFEMRDISNRKETTPFSEKLGEEIFQLDADSFARCIFMPQSLVHNTAATTSIRTKLSNLVDDTNDMNNFDTAMESLKQLRSKLRAYRGSGGSISNMEEEYNKLDEQKYEAEKKKSDLGEILSKIENVNSQKDAKIAEVGRLREKIRASSVQKAVQSKKDRLKELNSEVYERQQTLQTLDDRYPAGYPTIEEIKTQRKNLTILQQEVQRLAELQLDNEDRKIVERDKALFKDVAEVSQDIETCDQHCNEFTNVSAKIKLQMRPEELQQLDKLSVQFEEGVPSEEEINNCLKAADIMNAAQTQLSSLKLSAEEQECLEQLKKLFKSGVPDDNMLTACEQNQREQEVLLKSLENCRLSDTEQQDYQTLLHTFASGVPTEQEIQNCQKDYRRIIELTSIKNTKTMRIQDENDSEQHDFRKEFLFGGIGAVSLIIGIVCFIVKSFTMGILFLIAGFAGVMAAFWFYIHQMIKSKGNKGFVVTSSAITEVENQELYNLQRTLNDFLLQFYSDVENPEDKLVQLMVNMKKFNELNDKMKLSQAEQRKINQKIEEINRILHKVFEQYYPDIPYYDTFIHDLRESRRSYEMLNDNMKRLMNKRAELSDEIKDCRTQVIQLLSRYYSVELPTDLRQGIHKLSLDKESYMELRQKKQKLIQDDKGYQKSLNDLTLQIQRILNKYDCLDSQYSFNQCLQRLRKRFEAYKVSYERVIHYNHDYEAASKQKQTAEKSIYQFLKKYKLSGGTSASLIDKVDNDTRKHSNIENNLNEARKKRDTFLKENPEVRKDNDADTENLPDLEVLQEDEQKIQQDIEKIENHLRELRQERDSLRRIVENIPMWEDQMNRMKNEKQEAEKKCNLVDKTMEFMNQAKDNLANSYVGKVERGFEKYANLLLDRQINHVILDKDLKLYIDEQGESREVGSFSVGMVDSVMLCMRLSLVEALFTREKPFFILDDPFVNLDDEHTRKALDIIKKISEDYQVIYLVCNSSRC